jgi:DNA-binding transcriptional MerR regulator
MPEELSSIGSLAQAVGKSPITIRAWIRKGWIPPNTLWTDPIPGTLGDAGRRLWTRQQVEEVVEIARERGLLKEEAASVCPYCGAARELSYEELLAQHWDRLNHLAPPVTAGAITAGAIQRRLLRRGEGKRQAGKATMPCCPHCGQPGSVCLNGRSSNRTQRYRCTNCQRNFLGEEL